MEKTHICTTGSLVKDLLRGRNRLTDEFTCGGCMKTFETVCVLHAHCMKHNGGGSYFFDHVTSTAYPKYDTHCSYTQVSDDDFIKPDGKEMLARPRDINTCEPEREIEWGTFEHGEDEQTDGDSDSEDAKDFDLVTKSTEDNGQESLVDNIDDNRANIKINDSDKPDDTARVVDSELCGISKDMGVVAGEADDEQNVERTVVTVRNIGKAEDGSITFEMNANDTHLFDATASAIMDRIGMMGYDWIDPGMELQIVVQQESGHHTDTDEKAVKSGDMGEPDDEQRPDNKRAVGDCPRDTTAGGKSGIDDNGTSDLGNGAEGVDKTGWSRNKHGCNPEVGNEPHTSVDNKTDSVDNKGNDNVKAFEVDSGFTEADRVSEIEQLEIHRGTEEMTSSRRSTRKRKPNTRLQDSEWDTPTKKVKSELNEEQDAFTGNVADKLHDSNQADVSAGEVLLSLSETNTDGTDIDKEPLKRRLRKQKGGVETLNETNTDGTDVDEKPFKRRLRKQKGGVETKTNARLVEGVRKENMVNINENNVALQCEETSNVLDSSLEGHEGIGDNVLDSALEGHEGIGDNVLDSALEGHEGIGDNAGTVKVREKGKESAHKNELVLEKNANDTYDNVVIIKTEDNFPEDDAENSIQNEILTVQKLKSAKQKCRRKQKVGAGDAKRKDHVCPVCGKVGTLAMVKYHKEIHSSEMPYTCEICGKGFKTRPCFKAHARQHGEKKFQCQLCPMAFFRNQYLVSHMRSHTGETPFVCDLCGSRFKEFYILQRHIGNVHRQERKFECDICHEKFFRLDTRDKHRLRHFPASIKCTFCSKMFKGELDRRKHELTHTGDKQVFCPLCHQGFAQLWSYYRHMWKKHNIQKEEAKETRIKNPDLVFMRNKNLVYITEDGDESSGPRPEDGKVTVLSLGTGTGSSATNRIDAQDGDVGISDDLVGEDQDVGGSDDLRGEDEEEEGSDDSGGEDEDGEVLGDGETDLAGYQRLVVSTDDRTVEQLMVGVDHSGTGLCGAAGNAGLDLGTGVSTPGGISVEGLQGLVDSQGDRNAPVAINVFVENIMNE